MKPLYQKIIDEIRDEIKTMDANTPILSERELEKKFKASRMTVRKALSQLVEEGELYRVQNVGTFVSDKKLHKKGNHVHVIDSFNVEKAYRILYFDVKNDDKIVCQNLEIGREEKYIRVVRLNMSENEQPESIEQIYIVQNKLAKDVSSDIHRIFEFGSKLETGSLNQNFYPMVVPIMFANLLKVKVNTPIIRVDTKIIAKNGEVFAFVQKYLHPETTIEITL